MMNYLDEPTLVTSLHKQWEMHFCGKNMFGWKKKKCAAVEKKSAWPDNKL